MTNQETQRNYSFDEILRAFFLRDSTELGMVVIYGLFSSLCSLVVPVAVQTFVNTLGFGLLLQPILILAAIVFFVLSFSEVVNVLELSIMELLQQRWFSRVALEFGHRLTRVDPDVLKKSQSAELSSYFLEIATIQKTLSILILDAVAVALQIFFGMLLLALYHPYFIVFDVVIIAFIALVFFGLRTPAILSSLNKSKAKYATTAWLNELVGNFLVFRGVETRKFAMNRVDELASEYVQNRKLHFKFLLKQIGGSALLQVVMSAILLGAGGWLVIERQLTLGQLVAAELVFNTVAGGISKFGKYLESYYDLHASMHKVGYLLDLPIESDGVEKFREVKLDEPLVQVQGLSFRDGFGKEVFSDLTFDVYPGTVTAIVGKNGCGKSVLAELLYGAKTPHSGKISSCGLDLRYSAKEDFRSYFALVGQSGLLSGTILDNIRMHRGDVGLEEVQEVLKGIGLSSWVDSLPEGLMTSVSSGRISLSSGQVQLVLLARGLVWQPLVLILDEALDALDPETCQWVAEFLRKRNPQGAVILTTRNPQLAKSFDQVVQLSAARTSLGVAVVAGSIISNRDGGNRGE
jgi:ABC-type branched-subunit amino acid transport system ATPase component